MGIGSRIDDDAIVYAVGSLDIIDSIPFVITLLTSNGYAAMIRMGFDALQEGRVGGVAVQLWFAKS